METPKLVLLHKPGLLSEIGLTECGPRLKLLFGFDLGLGYDKCFRQAVYWEVSSLLYSLFTV